MERRRTVIACAALLVAVAAPPARGVTISASSANVANPGDMGRICVFLDTGGEQVAGTQNDLRWDGNCATLSGTSQCQVAGSHGKQLQHTLSPLGADFAYRALLLSLSDTDAMPDGPLYCCNFQGEADAGQCCNISVVNVGSSSPGGKALPTRAGAPARICTRQSDQGGAIGSVDNGRMNQPLSASNEPAPGQADANVPAPASGQPAAPSGGGAPVNQMLPGGGTRVGEAPAQGNVPQAPALAQPTLGAVETRAAAAGQAGESAARPVAPPTAASTAASTTAPTEPVAGTPTVKARPTAAPTKAAPVEKRDAGQAAAPADRSSGWFGCQVSAGASLVPAVVLGGLALIGAVWRRRSRTRARSGAPTRR